LSALLDWHRNDPVDAWEENRNDIIYNSYQGNRNPFLDFPELVEHLWGTEMGVNWTGETLGIEKFNDNSFSIYPNPASNIINIKGVTLGSKLSIYNVLGKLVLSKTTSNEIDLERLNRGVYIIKIRSQNNEVVRKFIKN
jgi:hypothetical protein